jgi:hypothetical protein
MNRTINWEFVNERIIMIDTVLCAREVSIVGLYAPTKDETSFEKKNSRTQHERFSRGYQEEENFL